MVRVVQTTAWCGRAPGLLVAWCAANRCLWQSLYAVAVGLDVHNGHTGDLADTPPQVPITCRHDVALVLLHPLADAVICVGALVHAGDVLKAGVLGHFERHPVLLPQLLQLRHDTVRDAWFALGVQAVHHAAHQVNLVFNGEVDEVGIHKHLVGRAQLGVVLEEEGSRGFLYMTNFLLLVHFLVLFGGRYVLGI
eukprot:CAMPEP_0202902390 /NCGR_PEP_ID=MMETSP1392-20130828/16825_1 /ASSEMBLY_ACC=CAM_ASM_000868 /TAXON_ID=225041 /ORGANISM="Chlamydomonas chlamydogama, Strain SAG 11-48b" /LENGTH=193 /DNA_ID=CAMNT_0049589145 /DNA_START=745 /DNA_END=1326 /DNA_ORIENTATION=-